jgi:pyruvate,water dikinase
MIQELTPQGVSVPNGFATTAYAYRQFITEAGLEAKLRQLFANLDVEDIENLRSVGKQARSLLLETPFPAALETAIITAYKQLCDRYGENTDVAVRSSATAEDLPDASFAGQQETYLNVHGVEQCSMPAIVALLLSSPIAPFPIARSKVSITSMWLCRWVCKKWCAPIWRLRA